MGGCCTDGGLSEKEYLIEWQARAVSGLHRDGRFAPTMVLRRTGGVLQSGSARQKGLRRVATVLISVTRRVLL